MEIATYPFVVVGSGLFGSVLAERITTILDQPVLVVEKRNHIGGNCFSKTDDATGIEYHQYGTHIFHTSNPKVEEYISKFCTLNFYTHQVLSSYKNKIYQLPINLETINSFYNVNLRPFEVDDFLASKRVHFQSPSNFEEKAQSVIGKDLYEAFIKGYTLKQWQINPKKLPANIFDRIPFRKTYNENYFFDKSQGIPLKGYTEIFNQLLSNKKIKLLLNTDFFSIKSSINPKAQIIYSGPIDRFFNYMYGSLSWRTLEFKKEILDVEDFQGNSVINYPELSAPYTRIHEPRHLHPERTYTRERTIIIKEYSKTSNGEDPFYPIAIEQNNKIYNLYRAKANSLKNIHIGGRLGDYQYLDMDKTIENALNIFETKIITQHQSNQHVF